MKNIFFTISLLILVWSVNSQNRFYIGDKSYPSSDTFSVGGGFVNKLNVSIAKDDNRGIFVVSIDSHVRRRILNTLIIYLDDGSIIKCIDRNIFDIVNNEASTVYYLTPKEIEKLKNTNISSIRFDFGIDNSFAESYSKDNSNSEYGSQKKIDFPRIFRKMF